MLVPPSPKAQLYVYGPVPPFGLQVNATARGAAPEVGVAEPVTDRAALTTIVELVHCAICESESVTVTDAW